MNYQSDSFSTGNMRCSNAVGGGVNLEYGVTGVLSGLDKNTCFSLSKECKPINAAPKSPETQRTSFGFEVPRCTNLSASTTPVAVIEIIKPFALVESECRQFFAAVLKVASDYTRHAHGLAVDISTFVHHIEFIALLQP